MKSASARSEDKDVRDSSDDLIANLGTRLRGLRIDQKLTLEMVASRAHVSRAMISKIERGEKMPTVGILVRVATALDVTLSALLGAQVSSSGIQLQRADACNRFTDPATGLVREVVFSPSEGEDVELVRHVLPGLQSSGTLAPYPVPTHKLVFSPSGPLVVKIGSDTYYLETGDSLRFAVTTDYSFFNPQQSAVSYYLLMTRLGTIGARNP
jgi:transcriptional regulator with XRE-family HTH domain